MSNIWKGKWTQEALFQQRLSSIGDKLWIDYFRRLNISPPPKNKSNVVNITNYRHKHDK